MAFRASFLRRAHVSTAKMSEEGSTLVEFALVSVLLIFLTLAILQVAVYLYIRNVAAASVAEGARYAAAANVSSAAGASRARVLLGRGVGESASSQLSCTGRQATGTGGIVTVEVRCDGALPVFFAPLGDVLPLEVRGHAVKEGRN